MKSYQIIQFANFVRSKQAIADMELLKEWQANTVKETQEYQMCDHDLSIGDYVEVNYKSGGGIKGKIVEFNPFYDQAKTESGWCFHGYDTITKHNQS